MDAPERSHHPGLIAWEALFDEMPVTPLPDDPDLAAIRRLELEAICAALDDGAVLVCYPDLPHEEFVTEAIRNGWLKRRPRVSPSRYAPRDAFYAMRPLEFVPPSTPWLDAPKSSCLDDRWRLRRRKPAADAEAGG